MTVDTSSTAAIYELVRGQLLNFAPKVGSKIVDVLSDIWVVQAPDDAQRPYGVLRFINTVRDGAYGGYRQAMEAELMLYAQPRSKAAMLEGVADVADQALLGWRAANGSVVFSFEGTRLSLPPAPPPADREVVMIRLTYPVVVWPTFLTQYANS